ncbi:MAG: DEAD/DEAH box helicase family protein [Syntrophomonadaceae bacterium]|jgi:hypothetical protein
MAERKYISDVIDTNDFVKDKFNLIASGCGTGKSRFISTTLLTKMPWIKPYEVLLVTSRSLTVEQQTANPEEDGMERFNIKDKKVVNFWNADSDDIRPVIERGIQVMTYDKIIKLLVTMNPGGSGRTLERIKIIVFDECHTLFSDRFIRNMESLVQWIRRTLDYGGKYIIGLTATPDIMRAYGSTKGFVVNQVNKDVLPGYVAKKMVCTNFDTIPYLIGGGKLEGRTIIMAPTIKDCKILHEAIPNSAMMFSQNNDEFTHEMDAIRSHIVREKSLPEKYKEKLPDNTLEERDLHVLICTSTAREGFSLLEESGVRNVVCCLTDPLHVIQFVGRARYNLDTIVVADTYAPYSSYDKSGYLSSQRELFKSFLYNKNAIKWFSSVAHLVEGDVYAVKRFALSTDEGKFISYINGRWLMPIDVTKKEMDHYRIWKDEDKAEIVERCIRYKILAVPPDAITFHRVVTTLTKCFGYTVNDGRLRVGGRQKTYKLIVSFDEDKIDYEKAVKPLD